MIIGDMGCCRKSAGRGKVRGLFQKISRTSGGPPDFPNFSLKWRLKYPRIKTETSANKKNYKKIFALLKSGESMEKHVT